MALAPANVTARPACVWPRRLVRVPDANSKAYLLAAAAAAAA